jgi:hypothetical protein
MGNSTSDSGSPATRASLFQRTRKSNTSDKLDMNCMAYILLQLDGARQYRCRMSERVRKNPSGLRSSPIGDSVRRGGALSA